MSSGGDGGEVQTQCEQDFQAPLVGLRTAALANIGVSSKLDVKLVNEGEFVTVACYVANTTQLVGSLAGFRGVRELIRCLEQGFEYSAAVVNISATQVDVHVSRAKS